MSNTKYMEKAARKKGLNKFKKYFKILIAFSAICLVLIAAIHIMLSSLPMNGEDISVSVSSTEYREKRIFKYIPQRQFIVNVISAGQKYILIGADESDAPKYKEIKESLTEFTVYKYNDKIYVDKNAAKDDTILGSAVRFFIYTLVLTEVCLIGAFPAYVAKRHTYKTKYSSEEYDIPPETDTEEPGNHTSSYSSLAYLNFDLEREINSIKLDSSPFKPYRDIRFSYIGQWTLCDVRAGSSSFDWKTILDWAQHMIGADFKRVDQVTIQSKDTAEKNCIAEYKTRGKIKTMPILAEEKGLLSIAGKSVRLDAPLKIVWVTHTNKLRFFTTITDKDLIQQYAEDMITKQI